MGGGGFTPPLTSSISFLCNKYDLPLLVFHLIVYDTRKLSLGGVFEPFMGPKSQVELTPPRPGQLGSGQVVGKTQLDSTPQISKTPPQNGKPRIDRERKDERTKQKK